MQLEINGKTFLITMIVAFGLILEALKLFPITQGTHAMDESILGTTPYAVSEHQISQQIRTPRITKSADEIPVIESKAQAAPIASEFDLKGTLKKSQEDLIKLQAEEAKKKKALKGWKWMWNKKHQRWVWKKAPKKMKAVAGKSETELAKTPEALKKPVPPAPASLAMPNASAMNQPTFGSIPMDKPHKFLSAAEWEALLLKTPNAKETDNFITQYKQHLVTEQVFYGVVSKMLRDSRSDMQQQGIRALGLTDSVKSFDLLAVQSKSLQTSSPTYQSTMNYLNEYSQLKSVGILRDVLTQSQPPAGVLAIALTQLSTSIQTNLQSTTGPSSQSANLPKYKGFVPVLTQLAANPSAADVRQQAESILSTLNSFIPAVATN